MVPALVFSDFIMIQTEFGLSLFKTLLNGPSKTAEPYEQVESIAEWRVTYMKFVIRIFPKASAQ